VVCGLQWFLVTVIVSYLDRLQNDLYCVQWDVKLYYTILVLCYLESLSCIWKHKLQTEESRDSPKGGKWSRVTRKHVIIGVTCAVVVAMVITGVLVGVKFYMDSANELVTVSSQMFCFAIFCLNLFFFVVFPQQRIH